MRHVRATAVLADDEPLLRADLRQRLAKAWPGLEVVAEAASGIDAVAAVAAHAPDVIFLDVQMPRMNGIDAAARMQGSTAIVFLTAYDQYAVAAFEHRATDYLVKPVDSERLAETVARLCERLQAGDVSGRLDRIAQAIAKQSPAATPARLQWIKTFGGTSVRLIPVADVMAFKAVSGYTQVVTAQASPLINTPLRDLVPQLDPAVFVQVHRNAIVNLQAVELAHRLADGRYAITLRGGRGTVETSRTRAHLFKDG